MVQVIDIAMLLQDVYGPEFVNNDSISRIMVPQARVRGESLMK